MLTPLSLGLRPTLLSKNLHIWAVRKPLHCLAPTLSALSCSHHSLDSSARIPSQTSVNTSPLNRNLLSCDCDTSFFSRGFSTSRRSAAKELSDKGDVVYRGAISTMIKGVKIFSLSTSALGICLQPMLLFSNQELPMALRFAVGGFLNFFIFMNPFIIHYIAKKYVTELRWNRSTGVFTAVTWTFFVQRRELQFTAEDVKVPDMPGMFTFLEAKGTPLFLEPNAFEDKEAYIHLMGLHKPLDWEIPPRDAGGQSEKRCLGFPRWSRSDIG